MTARPPTHPYQADPYAPADWKGEKPCTWRRIGEDDDL